MTSQARERREQWARARHGTSVEGGLATNSPRNASLDADQMIATNEEGFVPPWDGWDVNEWEQCTPMNAHMVKTPPSLLQFPKNMR